MSEEKTKPPTQKRLRDARRDGETAKSSDATAAAVLISAYIMLSAGADYMTDHLRRLFAVVWIFLPARETPLAEPLMAMATEAALLMLPLALIGAIGAIVGTIAQGAMTFSSKPVTLKLDKINPVAGFKKLFSMRAVIDAIKIVLKTALLAALLWQTSKSMLPLLVGSTARSPEVLSAVLWPVLLKMLAIATAFFAVFGVIDFGIQRFLFIRDKRMSEDEIKREYKESDGNPEIKQARRQLAHELVMEDPPRAVAASNMVVMNPTHYAVALHYLKGDVPRVVAKGRDAVALKLRAIAEEAGVPVVINAPLARTLYRVALGECVPRECFQIVSMLLYWVDSLHNAPAMTPLEGAEA